MDGGCRLWESDVLNACYWVELHLILIFFILPFYQLEWSNSVKNNDVKHMIGAPKDKDDSVKKGVKLIRNCYKKVTGMWFGNHFCCK